MIEVSFVKIQSPIGRQVDNISLRLFGDDVACVDVVAQPGGNFYAAETGRLVSIDAAFDEFASVVEKASKNAGIKPIVVECDLAWDDLWFWEHSLSGEFILQQGLAEAAAYPVADTDFVSACRKTAQAIRDLKNGAVFEDIFDKAAP